MNDFFVSYKSNDSDWAEWIAWELESAGFSAILQAWDFKPGNNFAWEIQKATNTRRTLVVLSAEYVANLFTMAEWAAAFTADPLGEDRRLIPVRVEECTLSGLHASIVYIDLVGLNEVRARERLLAGVSSGRAKPSCAPPFPSAKLGSSPGFPGKSRQVWGIPFRRNPHFVGREPLMHRLTSSLQSAPILVLTGLGGVGKTQCAVEYAYRNAGNYSVIWFIRSELRHLLLTDLAAMASGLGLDNTKKLDIASVTAHVQDWLDKNNSWLLIFDNAEDAESIEDFLPRVANGHTIVTSRNPAWRAVGDSITVNVWQSTDSADFLLERTGSKDKTAAKELGRKLDHLPIALEQAGAYIEVHGISLARYLELFDQHSLRLLELGKPGGSYVSSVTKTWDLAFERVQHASTAAEQLLFLCSFWPSEGIRLKELKDLSKKLPNPLRSVVLNSLELETALSYLLRYSLLQRDDDAFAVHRLVQTVVRERLAPDQRIVWRERAMSILQSEYENSLSKISTATGAFTRDRRTRLFLSPPHLNGHEIDFVREAFETNYIAPLGPMVDAFEREFSEIIGMPYTVALSSGTAAIHLALREVGVGPGDEVICSTLTFVGGVNPIVYLGASPVFIDVAKDTWTLDPNLLERELAVCEKCGRLPKAVVATDLYGQCADLDSIIQLCEPRGIPIISDSAESVGATYKDRHAGNGANLAAYSFNGNKIITTSAGGMLASSSPELIDHARFLAQQARDPAPHYEHSSIGYNYRMSNVLAAIGLGQLKSLAARVEAKRQIFSLYVSMLMDIDGIGWMPEANYGRSSRWLTCMTIDPKKISASREDFRFAFEVENIEARPIWKPMHLQSVFKGCRTVGGDVAEELFMTSIVLPSGSAMSQDDVARVAKVVRRVCYGQNRNHTHMETKEDLTSETGAPYR